MTSERPDWERLLAAERHVQALVPGAVLVVGTAAALHAGHRQSLDGDHVLERRVAPCSHRGTPVSTVAMERLVVGWNRDCFDLRSDEMLAQVMDQGDLVAWRELYALAAAENGLCHRLHAIVRRVPLAFPHFWLAALASLGEPVDWSASLPVDPGLA